MQLKELRENLAGIASMHAEGLLGAEEAAALRRQQLLNFQSWKAAGTRNGRDALRAGQFAAECVLWSATHVHALETDADARFGTWTQERKSRARAHGPRSHARRHAQRSAGPMLGGPIRHGTRCICNWSELPWCWDTYVRFYQLVDASAVCAARVHYIHGAPRSYL